MSLIWSRTFVVQLLNSSLYHCARLPESEHGRRFTFFDLRKEYRWPTKTNTDRHMNLNIQIVTLALPLLLVSCASYGPYHPNTSAEPLNSVRGPKDGRYKLAFIEFGDQGSALDTSQRAAALGMIRETDRPLLFVYIHGWQNNAESGDVCRFEHFL